MKQEARTALAYEYVTIMCAIQPDILLSTATIAKISDIGVGSNSNKLITATIFLRAISKRKIPAPKAKIALAQPSAPIEVNVPTIMNTVPKVRDHSPAQTGNPA